MKFLSKEVVFVGSLGLALLSLLTMEELGFCKLIFNTQTTCVIPAKDSTEIVIFMFAALSFPLSLLTLPLKTTIFEAWKRYAIWTIPTILLLVAWIEAVGSGSGLFHPGELFYPLFAIIYGTSSLAIVFVGWRKTRKNLPFTPSSISKIGTYITLGFVGVLFVLYFLLLSVR